MNFVTRQEWDARSPKSTPMAMRSRKGFTFHWWGASVGATSHIECFRVLRAAQDRHMAPGGLGAPYGGNDIAYNFVICQHGFVFSCRGHNVVNGANGGAPQNNEWEAVCFMIGPGDKFTVEMKAAATELVRDIGGSRRNHRDFIRTECPGNEIANWNVGTVDGDSVHSEAVVLGLPVDAPAPIGPPWGFITVDGDFGEQTIKALQSSLNTTGANPKLLVDGVYGPATKLALQKHLNHTNGPIDMDGKVGPQTIRALQANVRTAVDGEWGSATTTALQIALNENKF